MVNTSSLYKLGIEANSESWLFYGETAREEDAVITLLWDLVDNTQDNWIRQEYNREATAKDTIQISIGELWQIMRQESTNTVFALYTNLCSAFPNQEDTLSRLFIECGFFADREIGDGRYNPALGPETTEIFCGGPQKTTIIQGVESFIFRDLGCGHIRPYGQVYTNEVDIIGAATNYEFPNRRNHLIVKGSFILIKNPEIDNFLVDVKFENGLELLNYQIENKAIDGLLYLVLPPPYYAATATITPISDQYEAIEPLIVKSSDYFSALDPEKSSFLTYKFTLKLAQDTSGTNPMNLTNLLNTLFPFFILLILIVVLALVARVFLGRRRKHGNVSSYSDGITTIVNINNNQPAQYKQNPVQQPIPPPPPVGNPNNIKIICPNCGIQLNARDKFCNSCGQRIQM